MLKRYLIAVDLDDTALDNLYELNNITVEVLRELARLGHKIMIATARPASMTLLHYKKLGIKSLTSLCNGADLVDFEKDGESLHKEYIDAALVREVLNIFPIDIIDNLGLERNDDLYLYGDMRESPYHVELHKKSNTQLIKIDKIPYVGLSRLFLRVRDTSMAQKAIEDLGTMEDISFYHRLIPNQKGQLYISIQSSSADKWFSIKRVADLYQIPIENTIAFGDEYNDKMMIENAGLGFVMANGNRALKDEIGRVTQYSNTQGGVGRELIRIFGL